MNFGKSAVIVGLMVLASLIVFMLIRYSSLQDRFLARVADEFQKQPLTVQDLLLPADIAHLPKPVRRYIEYSGSLNQPKLQNLRITCSAEMVSKPNTAPMKAFSVQYNFYSSPSRIFFMKASRAGLSFHALHVYAQGKATFVVRVLSLFNIVDLAGEQLTQAETVTVLNDLCVFAPAALIDSRLTWKETGPLAAQVTFSNGPYKVSALLTFNTAGELVNFVSDDRAALQADGSLRHARWSTPLRHYQDFNGRKTAGYGEAIWHYPEGDFTYGKFTILDIQTNVKGEK
ncbi:MAG: hypothetical protein HGA76_05870 [Candidatus Firestonebacteria bacterium]|nr:hypothetical protein [Candidatus Firestonebacteria bacterium]